MRTPARRNGVEDIAFPLRSFDPASPIAADSFRDALREERDHLRRFTPRFDYEIPVRAVQLPAAIGKALRREMSEGYPHPWIAPVPEDRHELESEEIPEGVVRADAGVEPLRCRG